MSDIFIHQAYCGDVLSVSLSRWFGHVNVIRVAVSPPAATDRLVFGYHPHGMCAAPAQSVCTPLLDCLLSSHDCYTQVSGCGMLVPPHPSMASSVSRNQACDPGRDRHFHDAYAARRCHVVWRADSVTALCPARAPGGHADCALPGRAGRAGGACQRHHHGAVHPAQGLYPNGH